MIPRDARATHQGKLRCINTRIVGVYDSYTKNILQINCVNGLTYYVDKSRFTADEIREYNGEVCFVQYTDTKGMRVVCDVVKDLRV
jgi:hypothetical protein